MKYLSPWEARSRTIGKLTSFRNLMLWLRNPIMLENIRRKQEKEYPYWMPWNSLNLHSLRGKTKNSYAMFVEGQRSPRIVLKKIIPTHTSYGVRLVDIWGIIYYNEPLNLFMYADYGIQNFGKRFSEDVSASRPSSAYNSDKEKKVEILAHLLDDFHRGGGLLWDQVLVSKYLNIIHGMMKDVEKGEI